MIEFERIINILLQDSKNLFKDLLIPLNHRSSFVIRNSPTIPVYFYRYIGIKKDRELYYGELRQLDKDLSAFGSLYLKIISNINMLDVSQLINKTQHIWTQMEIHTICNSEIVDQLDNSGVLPKLDNTLYYSTMKKSLCNILDLYKKNSPNANPTLIKNFSLKLVSWINDYVPRLLKCYIYENTNAQEIHNPKVIFYGDAKEHEIYFLIFLSWLGCDIVYINTLSDGKFSNVDKWNQYSKVISLPEFEPLKDFPHSLAESTSETRILRDPIKRTQKQEKSFEELANLSSSTVMIRIYDRNSECIGTGSGVIIDNKGLIVTNFHVIADALYYGVIFEGPEESHEYETYTIINADPERDLALIKIHLETTPVEIDDIGDVIRGQKVVAIGSPLGLMNTVSDGIVSGFRKYRVYDYIQTTAPISPGSSGGALLNMHGELIGVTSCGYIDGQNINLAIPSKDIVKMLEDKFTIMNMEIMNNYFCFKAGNNTILFDGFFRYQQNGVLSIGLYQSKQDKINFRTLTQNGSFTDAIERYYIDNIIKTAAKYNLSRFDCEIGGGNYVFSYSYNSGRITIKGWESI